MSREIKGNHCLLLGYGREGRSLHRFLAENAALFPDNFDISVADRGEVAVEKDIPPPREILSGEHYLSDISSYTTIIRSPGIPYQLSELQEAAASGAHLSSLTNLFFSLVRGKVIGVTGTKGKSTTSSLLSHLLKSRHRDVRLVGNIGVPALDLLHGHDENTVFVVELSSFQLEDLRYSPHIAILLDIFEEHLDHHGSFEKYVEAKLNIFRWQHEEDVAIYNCNHPYRDAIKKTLRSRPVTFCRIASEDEQRSQASSADYPVDAAQTLRFQNTNGEEKMIDLSTSPLRGTGNIENVMAAVAAALTLDENYGPAIESSLSEYTPLAHRLEFIGRRRGIDFYNDSLATIPQATESAVGGLGDRVQTLILGGFDRGISYLNLAHFLLGKKSHLKNLILFPTTGDKIWNEIENISEEDAKSFTAVSVSSMQEAVAEAFRLTDNERICLLSPASSSLNMFRDYQDRGDQFRREVERVK